ncbi:unnamed protein product [Caretta caretta]
MRGCAGATSSVHYHIQKVWIIHPQSSCVVSSIIHDFTISIFNCECLALSCGIAVLEETLKGARYPILIESSWDSSA